LQLVRPKPDGCLLTDSRGNGCLKVALVGGKGGVGKTTLSANLAVSIASRRLGVMLLDCDLSAGQIHLLLGISPCLGLAQVVLEEKALKEVIVEAGPRLHVAPGGPVGGEGLEMEGRHLQALFGQAQIAVPSLRILILDTGPSRISAAPGFARQVDFTVVTCTPEPTSVRATVALLEALCCGCPWVRPWVLVNMSSSQEEAQGTFERIQGALLPLFQDVPRYLGAVPFDASVSLALRRRQPYVSIAPLSGFSRRVGRLADFLCKTAAEGTRTEAQSICGVHGEEVVEDAPWDDEGGPIRDAREGLDESGMADEDGEEADEANAA
jgi:flagellar biosynthesis protein FlhG